MAEARLVMTEALIRDALQARKDRDQDPQGRQVRREKAAGRKAEQQRSKIKEARRDAPKA